MGKESILLSNDWEILEIIRAICPYCDNDVDVLKEHYNNSQIELSLEECPYCNQLFRYGKKKN